MNNDSSIQSWEFNLILEYCSTQQNRHFLGSWHKISVIKLNVAEIGEETVALLFSYSLNDLRTDETQ